MAYFRNNSQLDSLNLRFKWAFLRENKNGWGLNWSAPYTVVWLVLRGERTFLVDNLPVRIRQGDIIAFEPGRFFRIIGEDQPFAFYAIAFDAKIGDIDFSEMYRFPNIIPSSQLGDCRPMIRLWETMIRQSDSFVALLNSSGEIVSQSKIVITPRNGLVLNFKETLPFLEIQQLLLAWFAEFYRLLLPLLPDEPIYFDTRIHPICNYIHNQINQKITLKQLADAFYLSPSHLSYLFRKSLGHSPMAYVRMVRIKISRDLLVSTSRSIKDIADQFGFQNQGEFSRLFRQIVGMTPLQYRKKFKKAMEDFVSFSELSRNK